MPNQNGSVYGLTVLSPIREGSDGGIPHNLAIRSYLAELPRNRNSPFAEVSSTHMARLTVLDDVVCVGTPAFEEHLRSQYLVFESNFDGDLDTYLVRMARDTPDFVDSVWKHCVGYPGVVDVSAFAAYMKKCQVNNTFYFAHNNDKTVQQTLYALRTQSSVAAFILLNQGKSGAELKQAFAEFIRSLRRPAPAGIGLQVTD